MAITKEVVAVTGSYTDSAGNEKKRYHRVGSIIETKNGPMLKVESIPVGWDGWAYLNEPKDREQQQRPQRQAPSAPPADDFSDDELIPF